MAIRHHNWLNAQASRRYPLDDNATGTGDDGTRLKDDIITDLHLRWPELAGQYAFIGGITVTANIVTAVILAADSTTEASNFTPLASVTVEQPVPQQQFINLEPLYPGVGGFIAFGDTTEPFNIRFSTPQQGLLSPKTARPYPNLPVPTMRKLGRTDGLTGLVRIIAGADIEIVKESVIIEEQEKEAMVIRLLRPTSERNVLSDYIGPCGKRPESRNCDRQGIETVNGVGPDCDGNLEIEFVNLIAGPFASCGSEGAGVTIDNSLGIEDVCTSRTPDRFPGSDYCVPEYSSSSASASGSSSSAGSESLGSSSSNSLSVSSSSLFCESLPYSECFAAPLHDSWVKKIGNYQIIESEGSGESGCVSQTEALQLSDTSRRNVIVWEDCGIASSYAKLAKTHLKLNNTAPKRNGGLVLNYHIVEPLTNAHVEYFVAQINQNENRVELVRFNGSVFVVENFVTPAIPFNFTDWYEIEAEVTESGANAQISVTVRNLTTPSWPEVSFTLLTSQWDEPDGFYGVHTDRANTDFCFWSIQDA